MDNLSLDASRGTSESEIGIYSRGFVDRRSGSTIRTYRLKRVGDIVISAVMILVLLPVGIVISGLIALGGGPIFYVTERPGLHGRIFRMYKFRTMVPDAEAVLEYYLIENDAARREYNRNFKLVNDPRVSLVGKFLRRFSLDELPQLINVLVGDMSLVGPRPRGDHELAARQRYNLRVFDAYFLCRPGMTGLWQVSGRSTTDYHARIRLDAIYVRGMSLRQDLSILLRTIPVIIIGAGAC